MASMEVGNSMSAISVSKKRSNNSAISRVDKTDGKNTIKRKQVMRVSGVRGKNGRTDVKELLAKDGTGQSLHDISRLFQHCNDIIWDGGKNDPIFAFDEFSKILVAKIWDEKINGDKSVFTTSAGVKRFYSRTACEHHAPIVPKIKLSGHTLDKLVRLLRPVTLSKINMDIKGQALEGFMGKILRGEYGQFFTPRTTVDFCVSFLAPGKKDTIIDPCCGSGGFLSSALLFINRNNGGGNHARRLFGIEINERISAIAMMDMLIHDGDAASITRANSLQHDVGRKYTMIFTNPPFGSVVTDEKILSNYKLRKHGKTEILFIEKCHNLLTNKGKMCIVLPDSVLTNSSLSFVRDYIRQHFKILAIVSLPQHTFIHADTTVKSSLLFLEKGQTDKKYRVFMGIANHIGYDSFQNNDRNELPEILENYRKKRGSKNSFFVNISRFKNSFTPSSFQTGGGVLLKDVCSEIFTGRTPARKDYGTSGIKILKVRDLSGTGIRWDVNNRGFVGDNYTNGKPLKINDIVIISSAHHAKYIGLKVDIINYVPKKFVPLYCTTEIMVIRPDPAKIDPYDLLYILKSPRGYEAIQSCVRGQTSHIYPKDIRDMMLELDVKIDKSVIKKLKKHIFDKSRLSWDIYQLEEKLLGKF